MSIKRKIYITISLVIIALAAMGYFLVWPTLREITGITQAIQREQEDLELKYQRGQRIRKIASEYKKIKPQRDRLNTIFVPSGDELQFITTLERLERQYQVEVVPTPDQRSNALGPNDPLPLLLSIRGNYPKVLQYLIALERLNYYFNVGSMSITGANPDTGALTLNLSGSIHRKPYQAKTADKPPAAPPVPEVPTATSVPPILPTE
ncbi:MAG: hypothetical protein Q7S23_00555 [bacterium]|nr:hypothetical protein [bacterium]